MKRLAYLLVLLLISAQVDDAWAVATVLPSVSLADENDEFLPAQRLAQDRRTSLQKPLFEALKPANADVAFMPRGLPLAWNSTTPFGPSPLYVFMSLQI